MRGWSSLLGFGGKVENESPESKEIEASGGEGSMSEENSAKQPMAIEPGQDKHCFMADFALGGLVLVWITWTQG